MVFRDDEHALRTRIESLEAQLRAEEERSASTGRQRTTLVEELSRLRGELSRHRAPTSPFLVLTVALGIGLVVAVGVFAASTTLRTYAVEPGPKAASAIQDVSGEVGALRRARESRRAGRVLVRSNPPGADVYESEVHAGVTPVELELSAGPHEIVLRRAGSAGMTVQVDVIAGSEITVVVDGP